VVNTDIVSLLPLREQQLHIVLLKREVVGSMKEYEDALLTRPEFMRIHRFSIVHML